MASAVASPMPSSLQATRLATVPSRLPSSSSTFGGRVRSRPSVRTLSFTQPDTTRQTPEKTRERTQTGTSSNITPPRMQPPSPGPVSRSASVPSGELSKWRSTSIGPLADRSPSIVLEEEADPFSEEAVEEERRKAQSFKGRLTAVITEANDRHRAQQALDKDLLAASAKGRVSAVGRLLSESSANPNCVTRHGMTPLHYAACRGSGDCVQQLLAAGADPTLVDSKGKSPLDYAQEKSHTDIVRLLEAALGGAPPTLPGDPNPSELTGSSTWPRVKRERIPTAESQLYIHVAVKPGQLEGPFFAPHTTYTVTMTTRSPTMGRRSFTVRRRFTDFHKFYQTIMHECPNNDTRKRLEQLEPQKTALYRYTHSTIEKRAFQFQQILTEAAHETALLLFVVDFLSAE